MTRLSPHYSKEMENPNRLQSLDVFRGATIAAMILVNNPGSWEYSYAQLKHAAWHGWTFTDWIFPFFLFIVGVAMTFSFPKRLEQGQTKKQLLLHTLRRAVILFALGLLVNGFPFGLFDHQFSCATLRIPGVLQRIAICFLIASIIFMTTKIRGQIIWTVSLLAVYWLLIKLVPVPGFGAGVMAPTGNLCWYVDSTLLHGHTWIYAPAEGFDPEGIVSTIPAIATTLFGLLTGQWLRSERSREEKTVWMFVMGQAMLLLGVIFDNWLPINKNMWTSSYSVFMAGWALICLATFYWLIDVKGMQRWAKPFTIFGMNAITVFVLSELLAILLWVITWKGADGAVNNLHDYIHGHLFMPLASTTNASLLFAIAFVLAMYLLAWAMWKKRWFLKV